MGTKDVTVSDLNTNKLKGETPPNHAKPEIAKSSAKNKIMDEKTTSGDHVVSHTSNSNPTMPLQEPLKPSFRPVAPLGTPFAVNRFKLDNRPTAFRIVPPLPAGLANVSFFGFFHMLSFLYIFSPRMKFSCIAQPIWYLHACTYICLLCGDCITHLPDCINFCWRSGESGVGIIKIYA